MRLCILFVVNVQCIDPGTAGKRRRIWSSRSERKSWERSTDVIVDFEIEMTMSSELRTKRCALQQKKAWEVEKLRSYNLNIQSSWTLEVELQELQIGQRQTLWALRALRDTLEVSTFVPQGAQPEWYIGESRLLFSIYFFIELKITVSIFSKTEFQSFGVDLCLSFSDWNLETLKPWRSTRQGRWDAFAVSNSKQSTSLETCFPCQMTCRVTKAPTLLLGGAFRIDTRRSNCDVQVCRSGVGSLSENGMKKVKMVKLDFCT